MGEPKYKILLIEAKLGQQAKDLKISSQVDFVGLKDAIGPCGLTFDNGDVAGLTAQLFNLLSNLDQLTAYRKKAKEHLSHYKSKTAAKAYLEVIARVMQ